MNRRSFLCGLAVAPLAVVSGVAAAPIVRTERYIDVLWQTVSEFHFSHVTFDGTTVWTREDGVILETAAPPNIYGRVRKPVWNGNEWTEVELVRKLPVNY